MEEIKIVNFFLRTTLETLKNCFEGFLEDSIFFLWIPGHLAESTELKKEVGVDTTTTPTNEKSYLVGKMKANDKKKQTKLKELINDLHFKVSLRNSMLL